MAGEILYWIALPALVAAGSSALVWLLMNARIEVLKSHYRAAVSQVESTAAGREAAIDAAVRDARARGRQEAMEELLASVRVEERRYQRKLKRLVGGEEERLVVQERIFLGNIPITGWIEHELAASTVQELPRASFPASTNAISPVRVAALPVLLRTEGLSRAEN